MNRVFEIRDFLDIDTSKNIVVEPDSRYEIVKKRLFEVIKRYNPERIVKSGIGSGKIIIDILDNFESSTLVVVESSFKNIKSFLEINKNNPNLEKIYFINGDVNILPVDYYMADLFISIDNLDFIVSSASIDEFRRVIQFDSILFISALVLHKEDLDGILDDLMKMVFPIHNEYYIPNDLKVILELNGFKVIDEFIDNIDENIFQKFDFFKEIYGTPDEDPMEFIKVNKSEFELLYKLTDSTISHPYYTGVFMKNKPDQDDSGKIV
jgi:ubiquinone/menaquinone biosynthesis C-methylase UbiE